MLISKNERVTITLPAELVREIDRFERNRSRFMQRAARAELERRRRDLLRQSLRSPHPETTELADVGLNEWAAGLPDDDVAGLVDLEGGKGVRWTSGEGWTEG